MAVSVISRRMLIWSALPLCDMSGKHDLQVTLVDEQAALAAKANPTMAGSVLMPQNSEVRTITNFTDEDVAAYKMGAVVEIDYNLVPAATT